jgi:hypothetical protein
MHGMMNLNILVMIINYNQFKKKNKLIKYKNLYKNQKIKIGGKLLEINSMLEILC